MKKKVLNLNLQAMSVKMRIYISTRLSRTKKEIVLISKQKIGLQKIKKRKKPK